MKNSPPEQIASKYFGGIDAIQRTLVHAVKEARKEKGWTTKKLDELCGLGRGYGPSGARMPSCEEFENDHRLMTSGLFALVAFPLRLKVDRVLTYSSPPAEADLKGIVDLMKSRGLGFQYGGGVPEGTVIKYEHQIHVFLKLRALDEVDHHTEQTTV